MQIRLRCYNCSTPFVITPDETLAALNYLHQEGFKHYNAICPRCGRANKIAKKQLRRANPGWEPPTIQPKPAPKLEKPVEETVTSEQSEPKAKKKTPPAVKAKAKTKTKTKAKTKSTPKTKAKTKTKTEVKTKAQPKTKAKAKTKSKTKIKSKAKTKATAKTKTKKTTRK